MPVTLFAALSRADISHFDKILRTDSRRSSGLGGGYGISSWMYLGRIFLTRPVFGTLTLDNPFFDVSNFFPMI